MSDGAKMVDVSENILQGFYGQTPESTKQNSNESNDNLQASTPPQDQEYPISTPATPDSAEDSDMELPIPALNENIHLGEFNGDIIRQRVINAIISANRRLKDRRHVHNRRLQASIGLELRFLADNFLRGNRHAGFIALRDAILKKEDRTEEENFVVHLINSYVRENEELQPTIISQICQHLQSCVTSSTFRLALEYLCYSPQSVPEELAAACDLAYRIYPKFQDLERANSIYNTLAEFIEKILDEVRH